MRKRWIISICLLLLSACRLVADPLPQSEAKLSYDETAIMRVHYPLSEHKELNDEIHTLIDIEVDAFEKQQGLPITLALPKELNIDYILHNPAPHLTSIIFTVYTYIESPKQRYVTLNYDTLKHRRFTLDDILQGSYQEALAALTKLDSSRIDTVPFSITPHALMLYDTAVHEIPLTSIAEYQSFPLLSQSQNSQSTFLAVPAPNIDYNRPMIALTFDDGPSIYTKEIIDLLKEHNGRATFFVLGSLVTRHPDILMEAIANGNQIGNHSYNHKRLTTLSKDDFNAQIMQTQTIMQETLHYLPSIIRPPYGAYNKELKDATKLSFVLWTLDTRDWESRDKDKIVARVMKDVKNGDILLFHDIYPSTVEAIKYLVPKLINEGYQLVTVSELIANQKK